MFNVIGCLGITVATTDSIDKVIHSVLTQIPLGNKKIRTLRNALTRLTTGQKYHVEYGHSGCTIERL